MKWFGKSWGAPVCSYIEHTATPVGKLCGRCQGLITAKDTGFILPHFRAVDPIRALAVYEEQPWHRKCFLASVLGEKKALEIEEKSNGTSDVV